MKSSSHLFSRQLRRLSAMLLVTTAISGSAFAFDPSEGAEKFSTSSEPASRSGTPITASTAPTRVAPTAIPLPAAKAPVVTTTNVAAPILPPPIGLAPDSAFPPAPMMVPPAPVMVPVPVAPQPVMRRGPMPTTPRLPSTTLLLGTDRQSRVVAPGSQKMVVAATPVMPVDLPPPPSSYIAPAPAMLPPPEPAAAAVMDEAPLATEMRVPSVAFPRVDAQAIQRTQAIQAAASPNGYLPPPPLVSGLTGLPEPLLQPNQPFVEAPVAVAGVPVMMVPAPGLSPVSKDILNRIPAKLDSGKPQKPGKIALDRVDPGIKALDRNKVDAYEATGIKISVRRPGLDTNYELSRAYTAMSGGDALTAMGTYKEILSTDPTNADALFGMASLYHREGNFEQARIYYGRLLKAYPTHRAGLANFLALVAEESPQDALLELSKLEQRDPEFSPIPAQEAVILSKMGHYQEASQKMLRAIELAPDNMTYKYNLAVMLDTQRDYAGAAVLYRLLIDAATRGAAVPAPLDVLQKRLNYIATVGNAQAPALPSTSTLQ